ncbi:hypothetical protein C2E23DRAFT_725335 [Lenzites betulinus]|nr:hypothetical protein C2E23DRAFT_725335 [Lenzites betulinus]
MDTLPLEILQHIFELACTDGGFTGCSLSLSSKAIRAAAHLARFHSVVLNASNPQRLESFLSTYREQSELQHGARLRVKHLYVTLSIEPAPIAGSQLADVPESSWWFPQATQALFRAVSEDVASLAIQVYPGGSHRVAFSCTFPCLRELAVFGVLSPDALFGGPADSPLFPQLRRLHVVDTSVLFPAYRRLSLTPWFQHAPRMSHLRVSNLKHLARNIPTELAEQLGVPLAEDTGTAEEQGQVAWPDSDDCPPRAHPHLRGITLRLYSPPPVAAFGGRIYRSYHAYQGRLKRLASYPAYVGLKIDVLEPPKESGMCSFWSRTMRAEWIDRIDGGLGGWEADEEAREVVRDSKDGPGRAVSFPPL